MKMETRKIRKRRDEALKPKETKRIGKVANAQGKEPRPSLQASPQGGDGVNVPKSMKQRKERQKTPEMHGAEKAVKNAKERKWRQK